MESWGFLEDVDTNAGAAAIAAIAATDQKHVTLSGTDTIIAPEHETFLMGIGVSDETPPTTDVGYLTISGYTNVKFKLPPVTVGGPGFAEKWFPNPIRIPPGASIACLANGSGAGAEEHAVILYVHNPQMQPWPVANIPRGAFPYPVEMVTDAPPAAVRWTPIEYSGRTNAYADSVDVLPDLPEVGVYLSHIAAELTTGYTAIKIEDNRGEKCLIWPCASTYDRTVNLANYIGGALVSPANACHKAAVAGVSNATQQMYLDLHITNWKSWGTGGGARGPVGGSLSRITGSRMTSQGPALDLAQGGFSGPAGAGNRASGDRRFSFT